MKHCFLVSRSAESTDKYFADDIVKDKLIQFSYSKILYAGDSLKFTEEILKFANNESNEKALVNYFDGKKLINGHTEDTIIELVNDIIQNNSISSLEHQAHYKVQEDYIIIFFPDHLKHKSGFKNYLSCISEIGRQKVQEIIGDENLSSAKFYYAFHRRDIIEDKNKPALGMLFPDKYKIFFESTNPDFLKLLNSQDVGGVLSYSHDNSDYSHDNLEFYNTLQEFYISKFIADLDIPLLFNYQKEKLKDEIDETNSLIELRNSFQQDKLG